jgi:hypothetical protein
MAVNLWSDLGYGRFVLLFWRVVVKRVVDFVVTDRREPVALIECKRTDTSPSADLIRLGDALGGVPRIQLVAEPGVDEVRRGCRVVTASRWLAALP